MKDADRLMRELAVHSAVAGNSRYGMRGFFDISPLMYLPDRIVDRDRIEEIRFLHCKHYCGPFNERVATDMALSCLKLEQGDLVDVSHLKPRWWEFWK